MKMKKTAFFLLLFFLLNAVNASAYEFTKINRLFSVLENDYVNETNLKNIALTSLKTLSDFDENLRFYNNDSQAFLYENNNLIGIFELPRENQNPVLWQELLTSVLTTSAQRSDKLGGRESELETRILKTMADNLDIYSRIDELPSAELDIRYDKRNNILYIRPTAFFEGISQKIQTVVTAFPHNSGLIFDLRECRGGSFNEALRTADLFLDSTIIAYSQGKDNQKRYYTATPGDILKGKPIAVLTGRTTASAAELVAAALSEQSRATLIGTRTYGKNSIQSTYRIKDRILFLTSGHFYTPSGKSLEKDGLTPQICTGINNSCISPDSTNSAKDIQIAINLIKKNFG